jgi:hypothetical protein
MAVGLMLTPNRKFFKEKWIWISALIALVIWLPNLIWQHSQDWPFFEHMRILSERQLTNVQPHIFTLVQLLMNLHAVPVWIAGLIALFTVNELRPFRPLAWLYLSTFVVLLLLNGKVYYLGPAYPMLFAAGAVALEKYFQQKRRIWLQVILFVFIIYNGIIMLPIGVPVLSVENMKKYFNSTSGIGTGEALRWEDGKMHDLPQDFADMLGWEEMATQVARIWHQLPADEKEEYAIFAANYGQAGAIDYYANKYDLPNCISKGSSYWLWGYRNYDGQKMIIIGLSEETVMRFYEDVESQPAFYFPHARESGTSIIIARGAKTSMAEMWRILKEYRY